MTNRVKIEGLRVTRKDGVVSVWYRDAVMYRVIWADNQWYVFEREYGPLAAEFLRGRDAIRWIKNRLWQELTNVHSR